MSRALLFFTLVVSACTGRILGAPNGDLVESSPRGMYVSAFTSRIGKVTLDGTFDDYAKILGAPSKEQLLLDFVQANGINSISFYNLDVVLGRAAREDALVALIQRLRAVGVRRIEGVAGPDDFTWNELVRFHNERERLDGFVTEIEFWNGQGTFTEFRDRLIAARSYRLAPTARGQRPTLAAYLGWPTEEEAQQILPLLDRVYLHSYVENGDEAFAYARSRFDILSARQAMLGTNVDVWPIFSAEGQDVSAGEEHFMGEWMREHGIEDAETRFAEALSSDGDASLLPVTGYQYYSYFFLRHYLGD